MNTRKVDLTNSKDRELANNLINLLIDKIQKTITALPETQIKLIVEHANLSEIQGLYEGDLTKPESLAYLLMCSLVREREIVGAIHLVQAEKSDLHKKEEHELPPEALAQIVRMFTPIEKLLSLSRQNKDRQINKYVNLLVSRWMSNSFLAELASIKQSCRNVSNSHKGISNTAIKHTQKKVTVH